MHTTVVSPTRPEARAAPRVALGDVLRADLRARWAAAVGRGEREAVRRWLRVADAWAAVGAPGFPLVRLAARLADLALIPVRAYRQVGG